jgi:hypothetical protein
MTIDPSQSKTPFASIINVSCYGAQEDEVLFFDAYRVSYR